MAIFDELKSVGKVLQEAGKIEQYKQILETQEKLLEMQKRIIDLEEDNRKLREQLEIKQNLSYENNAYWSENEGGSKDGPFCSHCWDKDKHLIRMHPHPNPEYFYCPECKNDVQISPDRATYKQRDPRDKYY